MTKIESKREKWNLGCGGQESRVVVQWLLHHRVLFKPVLLLHLPQRRLGIGVFFFVSQISRVRVLRGIKSSIQRKKKREKNWNRRRKMKMKIKRKKNQKEKRKKKKTLERGRWRRGRRIRGRESVRVFSKENAVFLSMLPL